MLNIKNLMNSLLGAALLSISNAAFAHFPLMHCWSSGNVIECEAGYSDGSKAINSEVKMFDYDDNLVAKSETDKRSIATFNKKLDEFYMVFDSGHEYPVEVDGVEISEK